MQQYWKSALEELPVPEKLVLVRHDPFDPNDPPDSEEWNYDIAYYFVPYNQQVAPLWNSQRGSECRNVTHWMELPGPPNDL